MIFPLLYDRQLKGTTWHFPHSAEYLLTKPMNSLDIHSVFHVTKATFWLLVPPVYHIGLMVCSLRQQFPSILPISTPVLQVGLYIVGGHLPHLHKYMNTLGHNLLGPSDYPFIPKTVFTKSLFSSASCLVSSTSIMLCMFFSNKRTISTL